MSIPAGVIRWGDFPVPYVAAWSSESVLRVDYDPVVQRPALFRNGRRGNGRPMFGKMDEARNRRVVVQNLCQVCTRALRGVGYLADVPHGRTGTGELTFREPLACFPCMRESLHICPGIKRMAERPRFTLARVTGYIPVAITVQAAEGGDAAVNAALAHWHGPPPVGYLSLALQDYERLTLDAFA